MQNTVDLDTSKFLNEEDINAISKLSEFKKDITAYFDMDLFIKKVSEIIDNSEHFSFRSKMAKLSIDKDKPTFIMKFISDEIVNTLKGFTGASQEELNNKQIDYVVEMISEDLISKISIFITDCIKDADKLDELFKDLPKDIKEFFISNIYTIRVSIEDNNIYMIYFI